MKTKLTRLSASLLTLALPAAAHAQAGPAAATPGTDTNAPSAGLANDWLRRQAPEFSAWDFGGQLRARWEHKENFAESGETSLPGKVPIVDFRSANSHGDNSYFLLRATTHLGYQGDWFGVYAEGRESSSTGDARNPNPESDKFDLHQGYLKLGNQKEFPVTAKIGRQELAYGDERLIGAFDWNNIGRSFDAAKLRFQDQNLSLDAFAGRVMIPTDNRFDVANDYDTLYGLYASSPTVVPFEETQLYFLARDTQSGSPNLQTSALVPLPSPRRIYTLGFRVKSKPGELNGWDYTAEADYQFGWFESATGAAPTAKIGARTDQEAYAAHLDGGYTWDKVWGKPRLALEFNYASGGTNHNTHATFDQMYPTGHAFSGIMDFYAWQNVQDARVSFTLKPAPKVTATATYRGVWLASTSDYFYQANTAARTTGGYGIHPGDSNFVGTELDLILTYTPASYAKIQGGYGHFFIGDYIKQSLAADPGGSADANYVYVQTTLTF